MTRYESRSRGVFYVSMAVCSDQLRHHILAHGRPQAAVVTAFDSAFVSAGIRVRDYAQELSLPFIGYCTDSECVRRFNAASAPRLKRTFVAACNTSSMDSHLMRGLPATERCLGWRRVQFVKVSAVRDVLALGVDVLLL